jgi:hypothetical protein
MKKILIDSYASVLEKSRLPDVEITFLPNDADIIVNPTCSIFMNKLIIINLPVDVPISQLKDSNQIISRFPIDESIPVIPYMLSDDRKDLSKEDYSCLILSDIVIKSLDPLKIRNNFILGIGEIIDGHTTAVGIKVLDNKVENILG